MQQLRLQKQVKLFLNKSQSAIEVLIAIVIFSTAFIALISLANNYLNALKTTRERILANFLAQEGLELVIAKRNIEQVSFSPSDGSYCIDLYTLNNPLRTSNACQLYINNNGFYNHSSATPTIFSRLISISSTSTNVNNVDIKIYFVTSSVYVNNQPIVELTTILTQWPF